MSSLFVCRHLSSLNAIKYLVDTIEHHGGMVRGNYACKFAPLQCFYTHGVKTGMFDETTPTCLLFKGAQERIVPGARELISRANISVGRLLCPIVGSAAV